MDGMIETKFNKMGARVRVMVLPSPSPLGRLWNGRRRDGAGWTRSVSPVRIDVRRDDRGEYFDVVHRRDVTVEVLDVRAEDRHLLLMARESTEAPPSKFLCGHDERAWFVAAIPESARARDVPDAKDALKPAAVWDAMREFRVPRNHRNRRRTDAFVRQGEWFFIPRPKLVVNEKLVLKNERIRRGAGKPHVCQLLCRTGGELVYVNDRHPNGLTVREYQSLPRDQRKRERWQTMARDARAYAKGAVRHPDHATVWLNGWHEVVMNTETQARAMAHVAFLD